MGLGTVVGCGSGGSAYDPIEGILHDPCAPVMVELEPTATAMQRQGVMDALAMWQRRAGALLTTDVVEGAARLPVRSGAAPRSRAQPAPQIDNPARER